MNNKYILIIVIVLILSISGIYLYSTSVKKVENKTEKDKTEENKISKGYSLKINNKVISLIVASSTDSKERGLSGMDSLPNDSAMLFIFDFPDIYGFWMKDMKFAIDIIWLDADKKIVYLEKNATPESYPNAFMPTANSMYVIETNSGFVDQNGLVLGSVLDFSNN